MLNKKLGISAAVVVMLGAAFAPMPVRAGSAGTVLHLNLGGTARVDQMLITERGDIEIYGHSLEAEGACLPAQILVEGERSSWWPVYTCATVNEGGEWFLRVASDEGQPEEIFFSMPAAGN